MKNCSVYQYTRLAPQSIRLIELYPSKALQSPLECRLLAVPLSSCPAYEALSYCWGSSDPADQTECESGAFISVTESCASALYQLRDVQASRLLWIDAVSINQSP
jgi:hypothetical protein